MGQHTWHRFDAHTSEVRLVAGAPDRRALFEEVARAVAGLMGDEAGQEEEGDARRGRGAEPDLEWQDVSLEASDDAALLVTWVDELVFRSEVQHRVFWDVAVDEVADGRLRGRLRGTAVEALRTAVKAATFHDIEVAPTEDGWRARVVLDV